MLHRPHVYTNNVVHFDEFLSFLHPSSWKLIWFLFWENFNEHSSWHSSRLFFFSFKNEIKGIISYTFFFGKCKTFIVNHSKWEKRLKNSLDKTEKEKLVRVYRIEICQIQRQMFFCKRDSFIEWTHEKNFVCIIFSLYKALQSRKFHLSFHIL